MAESKIEAPVASEEIVVSPMGDSWLRRWLLRFVCIYFLWYAVPNFLLPGRDTALTHSMDRFSAWVGENVLGLGDISVEFTGSGDKTVHYLQLLVMIVGSVFGSLVWTALDRWRLYDRQLGHWLQVIGRYYLMGAMLAYGFGKVFPGQFIFPSLTRLLQTYGDSSPMALLWTMMGYSRPYTVFAGLAEVAGGLLLAWRRTTTLGAMVVVGVMGNVVMMNLSYDVPVKLYASHILVFALVLVALDRRRVLNLLVLNRPTMAAVHPPHFSNTKGHRAGRLAKALLIGYFLYLGMGEGLEAEKMWARNAPKPPLWGVYYVETFVIDGETLPPLLTDRVRWQNVIFDRGRKLSIRKMDGRIEQLDVIVEGANKLSIYRGQDRLVWSYEKPSPGMLHLAGDFDGRRISLQMKARGAEDFLLLRRGFHWVNEEPFNR